MKKENKKLKRKRNLIFLHLLFPLLQSCPSVIHGTDKNDILRGTEVVDRIYGYGGNDVIYGYEDNDRIYGGEGADTIDGGEGADYIDGGEGNDTVSYRNSTRAVNINLVTNSHRGGDAQGDSLVSIENIRGSRYDDTLTGDNNDNIINGGGGSDTIDGGEGKDTIDGGEGKDTIDGGGGSDTIDGGGGSDTIDGGEGKDTIDGGGGSDTIDGGEGKDTIDGGGGSDTVSYESSTQAVNINLATNTYSGGDAQGDSLVSIENIIGSAFDDTLTGDSNNNIIDGGEGADIINGGGGADIINGGGGSDTIDGGGGADIINGGGGSDTISYENSTQAVIINLATNSHSGGDAEGDSLVSIENIIGSAFDDTLTGDSNNNIIDGGKGADIIDGGGGNDTVSYKNSTEAVNINLATNTHSGGEAQGDSLSNIENIIGSAFDDTLTGDDNDNVINAGGGSDTIDGGGGRDTVSYESSAQAVNINLATNTYSGGDAQGDSLSNIENIIGSDYNDTLTGDDNDNIIDALGGNDTIYGGGGGDTIDGGGGSDTVSYENSTEGVNVNLTTDTHSRGDAQGDSLVSIENIIGSDYSDSLTGDDNDNVINGGGGSDTIDGGEGVDTISYENSSQAVNINLATNTHSGGDAQDDSLVSIENIIGSNHNDILTGDNNDNIIDGGGGSDTIDGGKGADTIDGGEGVDTISYENSTEAVNINLATNTHSGGDAQDDSLVSIENIIGSNHNDILTGDNKDNIIDGGEGNDTVSYEYSSQAVNINLASNIHSGGDAEGDSLSNIENIIGSDYNDTLTGDDNDNVINGGGGSDTIDGGEGIDTVSYENSTQAVNVNLASNTHRGGDAQDDSLVSIENIIGSDYDDDLIGDDNDNVINAGGGSDTIDGGEGVDTISYENSSQAVNVNLASNTHSGGDAQDDSLVSIENIIGSNHNDILTGDNNDNIIDGGEGNDTISYEYSSQAVNIHLASNIHSGGDAEGDSLSNIENIIGSDYNDTLTGDDNDNIIDALGGNDTIYGGGGGDTIDGGGGSDTVSYENSTEGVNVNLTTDTHSRGDAQGDSLVSIENIIGSDYSDSLTGDDNDNVINGGGGSDTIDGGEGVDTISYENSSQAVNINLATNTHSGGDAQDDSLVSIENIIGSNHNDILTGDNNDNIIDGGGGGRSDTIDGGEGNDTVSYEYSSQAVNIHLASNIHSGGDAEGDSLSNIENIIGSSYDDTLIGDNNDNVINGGGGSDTIDGGEGIDTVSYENSTQAVNVNLASNTHRGGDAQDDSLVSIENIIGSDYDDDLIGDDNDNVINAGGGSDTIDGGEGVDTISYENSSQAVNVNLASNTHSGGDAQDDSLVSIENIIGSNHNDILTGDNNDNIIDGGEGNDTISYEYSSQAVNIHLASNIHSGGDAEGDSLSNIENIIGSDYNDTLTGDDNDNIIDALGGNDTIYGGGGGDTIDGGGGSDTVSYENSTEGVNVNLTTDTHSRGDAQGDSLVSIENIIGSDYSDSLTGDDNDNVINGGGGSDTIDGGEGVDTISYENSSQAVNINLATNTHSGGDAQDDSLVSIENIIGSNHNDILTGDNNDNIIDGGEGVDTISYENSTEAVNINLATNTHSGGDAQDDSLVSIENIIGSNHNDILTGDNKDNIIDGGEGNDTVSYEYSSQAVNINLASNIHSGGDAEGDSLSNIENIIGSDYNDTLTGDDNDNVINGGGGSDTIDGGEGIDTVSYENSTQAVNVNLASNTHRGGDAQDDSLVSIENIIGSDYDDDLIGDDNDNVINAGGGSDTIDGGEGKDTVSYENSSQAVNIHLASNIHSGGDAEGDSLSNIENIIGSDYNDTLTGDDNDNVINAGGGRDTIDGGEGVDTISYENSTEAVNIHLASNIHRGGEAYGDRLSNIENIIGSDYNDTLTGDDNDNVINGGGGNDTIDGGGGGDTIDGGEGVDTVSYEYSSQAVNVNLATNTHSGGEAQGDRLSNIENIIGSNYDDTLTGDNNDNIINGQRGYDTINGGEGNDIIYGGRESDTIDGGSGFDTLKTNGDLDLTTLADNLLSNIEKIDITGIEGADNVLTLSSSEISALGGFDTGNGDTSLIIEGDSGDAVVTTDSWTANGWIRDGGTNYNLFEKGTFQLLISPDVDSSGIL